MGNIADTDTPGLSSGNTPLVFSNNAGQCEEGQHPNPGKPLSPDEPAAGRPPDSRGVRNSGNPDDVRAYRKY